jgi:hypothetical protein
MICADLGDTHTLPKQCHAEYYGDKEYTFIYVNIITILVASATIIAVDAVASITAIIVVVATIIFVQLLLCREYY